MSNSINLARRNRFIGFYTVPSFWAISPPDFETKDWERTFVYKRPEVLKKMSEVVYEYSAPDGLFMIRVCRDGFIMFSNQELASKRLNVDIFEKWRETLKSVNALYLIFDSVFLSTRNLAYFKLRELGRHDVLIPSYDTAGDFLGFGGPIESYSHYPSTARDVKTYDNHSDFFHDRRIEHRQIVDESILDEVVLKFQNAVDANTIEVLNVLSKSVYEYKSGNYEASLVLSWTLLENWLEVQYINYIPKQGILKKISNFLTGKCFISASAQIVALKRKGVLTKSKEFNRVLASRNGYLHTMKPVSIEQAGRALNLCQDSLDLTGASELKLNLIIMTNGI